MDEKSISCKTGSRTIVPEENCPPTLSLSITLSQTLTGGQIFSGAIVRTPINPVVDKIIITSFSTLTH